MLSVPNHADLVGLCARGHTGLPSRPVVSEHSTLSRWAKKSRRLRVRLTPWLARCSDRWATAVVAVSQGVAHDSVEVWGILRERVEAIYDPVVTREQREKAAASLAHPWWEPGQPPVVLTVDSLTTRKGRATLWQALALVRRHPPVRLVILGEGPERPPSKPSPASSGSATRWSFQEASGTTRALPWRGRRCSLSPRAGRAFRPC